MHNFRLWPLVLFIFLTPVYTLASNKTLFEGYYKILSGPNHVGYYIQRYELDPKRKEFISTYFLKTNEQGGNITESLKAISTQNLNPVSYQYTSLQGSVAKTIDANMREGKKQEPILQVKVNENGKLRVYEKRISKGTFFSTFLIYLLLQGEKGISPGTKYNFHAIAEEDGQVFPGEVYVDSRTKTMGLDTFKVLYTFKRTQFVNFIDDDGESLVSISPALNISAEMVINSGDAIKGMNFSEKSIKLLFGNIPAGNINALSSLENKAKAQTMTPPQTTSTLAPKPEPKEDKKEKKAK